YISCIEEDGTPPSGNWTSANTCPENSPGSILSVRVTAQFTPITPVLGQLLGTVLSGSATMTIN
ncbi:MAG: hypothetical protein ACMG6H_16310, partial [Acidobacteriota bacterium]